MSDDQPEGPGQSNAPALFLRYRLTPADALVWEALPREASGWAKLAVFAPWIMLGLGWGAMDGNGLPFWQHGALATAPALAVWALSQVLVAHGRQRRAHARLPAPADMRCTVAEARLTAHPEGRPQDALTITPEGLRQVVLTPTHLFLDAGPDLLILPRAAFADAEAMAALAARWETLSRQAQP